MLLGVDLNRQWMKTLRPLNQIFSVKNYGKPKSADDCKQRLAKNLPHFASNYVFFGLSLLVFSMFVILR